MSVTDRVAPSTVPQRRGTGLDLLARKSVRGGVAVTLTYVSLVVGGAIFALPFYWMFIGATKPKDQLYTIPVIWWPREFIWSNFYDVWVRAGLGAFLVNTCIVTGLGIVGTALCSAIVGYGFARGRFWGRDTWFVILLATMMVPPQVTLIPLFIIYRYIGWLDTYLPLVVPQYLGAGALFIFLMRQFFLTIPTEYEEAARVDGASTLRIFWSIFMPLSVPALTTVVILSFMHNWNDFFGPLIFLTSRKNWTLQLGLASLAQPDYVDYNQRMSGAFLISLPCVLVFFLAQRYFTQGIVMSGIKG